MTVADDGAALIETARCVDADPWGELVVDEYWVGALGAPGPLRGPSSVLGADEVFLA